RVSSRHIAFLNTRPSEERYRVINTETGELRPNMFVHYVNRPDSLEDMCLGQFARTYVVVYGRKAFEQNDDCDQDAYAEVEADLGLDNEVARKHGRNLSITLKDKKRTKMRARTRDAILATPHFADRNAEG